MKKQYDLLTIGGGSGGIAATNRAARYGARCGVIERGPVGGTCVNVGCVPKKVMWYASAMADRFHEAKDYGFDLEVKRFSWARLVAARERYIERIRSHYQKSLRQNQVDWIVGEARFRDPKTVVVGDDVYTADHILIATGAHSQWPSLPGAAYGIDSDGFFALQSLPKRVAVVGAGYIAVELAGVLHGLGSDVQLLVRKHAPLRSFDPMLSEGLVKVFEASGLTLLTHHIPKQVTQEANGQYTLTCENGEVLTDLDHVIWAIGRVPNVGQLGLDKAGVAVGEDNEIIVDVYQNTNVKGVYAIGDVTGRWQLTPVAIAAGRRLSDRLFGKEPQAYLDYENIPTVIFSHPPIGTVGMTAPEAIAQYGEKDITVHESNFRPLYYALSETAMRTSVKVITQGENERVIGCHILGLDADEMLQGFAVAMKMGATFADLKRTVAIHPTSAEELVTL